MKLPKDRLDIILEIVDAFQWTLHNPGEKERLAIELNKFFNGEIKNILMQVEQAKNSNIPIFIL